MSAAQFATLAAVGLTSLILGFRYGRNSAASISRTLSASSRSDSSDDSDDECRADGELGAVKAGTFEQCKMVLCVRTDLKMTPARGPFRPQPADADMRHLLAIKRFPKQILLQAKVALKCPSEQELLLLQAKAQSLNLCARAIQDAGRTEIEPGTLTVLGIGPGPVELVNQVTGKMRLL